MIMKEGEKLKGESKVNTTEKGVKPSEVKKTEKFLNSKKEKKVK